MKSEQLVLAKFLVAGANQLLSDDEVVEALKKEPREHDPLVNELGDILGAKLAQQVSNLLDKNFPGVKLAALRQAIRLDTVNAFRKSLKRNFNSHYDKMLSPELLQEVEQKEAAEEAVPKGGTD